MHKQIELVSGVRPTADNSYFVLDEDYSKPKECFFRHSVVKNVKHISMDQNVVCFATARPCQH